jgi:TolB-like protein
LILISLLLGICFDTAAAASAQPAVPAVVVWDFDNQSALPSTPGDRVDSLRRLLSESLNVALLQVPGLAVVERQRLKDLLAEQKVASNELADDDTRLRLGRIIGAPRMVFGGYFVLGDQVQVHARLIDTNTSKVLYSDEINAPLDHVMAEVEPLVRHMVRALSSTAPAAGRADPAAPVAAPASESTWLAYDQALQLADAGRFEAAVDALQRLLSTDKDFVPAQRQLLALVEKMARR